MMTRLQKRCFATSASVHGVLALLLMLAPGFRRASPPNLGEGAPLELMSGELIDAALAPGFLPSTSAEAPAARADAPPPPPPVKSTPPPEPEPDRTPMPPRKEPPSEVDFDLPKAREPGFTLPNSQLDEKKNPKPKPKAPEREAVKIDLSKVKTLNPTPPPRDRRPSTRPESTGPSAEELARQRRQNLARSLDGASDRIAGAVSRGAVQVQIGPAGGGGGGGGGTGGGGSAYAWHVRNAFINAWIAPQSVKDDLATADVEVVIRKDGRVVQARIVKRSGVAALDRSVQDALDRVREIVPFESGATDAQRTYTIGFNLRSKRSF